MTVPGLLGPEAYGPAADFVPNGALDSRGLLRAKLRTAASSRYARIAAATAPCCSRNTTTLPVTASNSIHGAGAADGALPQIAFVADLLTVSFLKRHLHDARAVLAIHLAVELRL
jgi:hypothetical protein